VCEQGIKYTPPFADTTSNSGGMQWEGSASVGEGGVPHHSPRCQYTDRPKPTPCFDQDLCSRSIGGKHRFCNDNQKHATERSKVGVGVGVSNPSDFTGVDQYLFTIYMFCGFSFIWLL
jgi:hypothetical protein